MKTTVLIQRWREHSNRGWMMATKTMDGLIDEAGMESFPASDPPAYMAGASVPGPPSHSGIVRKAASTELLGVEGEAVGDSTGRIRERAYSLWEQEGRPEGRAEEHWHAARRELTRPK
jgi:hypothetical protein